MTKLLVLGLLNDGPLSGYDISQMINTADAKRWGGVLAGSVYHALKKLEQENYIELACIEQIGYRQKAVYKITGQGKKYLESLIRDTLCTSSALYPAALYSGLSVLDKIPGEDARQALEEQKKILEEEYKTLEQEQRRNARSGQEIPEISKLITDNMLSIIRGQQRFIRKLIETLENGRI